MYVYVVRQINMSVHRTQIEVHQRNIEIYMIIQSLSLFFAGVEGATSSNASSDPLFAG